MKSYLASTDNIDWQTPAVRLLAEDLANGSRDPLVVAQSCFEWVRDEIKHSSDHQLNPVTCSASEVLAAGTGYCYAKSHLLAALLRANGIPAGLSYQRLSIDEEGTGFCLHGLNAVDLPGVGWYRIDARGNRTDVDAQFTPPKEKLAFAIHRVGEYDLPDVYADPLPLIVETLRTHASWQSVLASLPDIN